MLVAVIYVALAFGAVTGLLAGTAGGLVQDALAGGIVGDRRPVEDAGRLLVGVLGAQFIVSQPLPRFVMFVGATFVHELCFQALYALVESRAFTMHYSAMLIQAVVNGAIGIRRSSSSSRAPDLLQRRQSRAAFSRRRY